MNKETYYKEMLKNPAMQEYKEQIERIIVLLSEAEAHNKLFFKMIKDGANHNLKFIKGAIKKSRF